MSPCFTNSSEPTPGAQPYRRRLYTLFRDELKIWDRYEETGGSEQSTDNDILLHLTTNYLLNIIMFHDENVFNLHFVHVRSESSLIESKK